MNDGTGQQVALGRESELDTARQK